MSLCSDELTMGGYAVILDADSCYFLPFLSLKITLGLVFLKVKDFWLILIEFLLRMVINKFNKYIRGLIFKFPYYCGLLNTNYI